MPVAHSLPLQYETDFIHVISYFCFCGFCIQSFFFPCTLPQLSLPSCFPEIQDLVLWSSCWWNCKISTNSGSSVWELCYLLEDSRSLSSLRMFLFLPVHWLRIKLLWQEPSSGRIPSYKLMDSSAAFFKVSSRIVSPISSIVLACYLSAGRDATGLVLYYLQWAHPQTKHPGKSLEYQLAQCSLTFLSWSGAH